MKIRINKHGKANHLRSGKGFNKLCLIITSRNLNRPVVKGDEAPLKFYHPRPREF